MPTLSAYLTEQINKLTSEPRSKEEIWDASEQAARFLNFLAPKFHYKKPVSIMLYRQIYSRYLSEDIADIQAMQLAAPEDCWYQQLIDLAKPGPGVDLSCISMPMVYRLKPSCPVSCALVVCTPTDNVAAVFNAVLDIVKHGIGVGIEMLSSTPNIIEHLIVLDRGLASMKGRRENFVAVNVLACHPDIEELLLWCNKSGGLFFSKINIGVWWSPKFLDMSGKVPRVKVAGRGQDLVSIKRRPGDCVATSHYDFTKIFDAKCRGGVPYILHIEACPNYENVIYGSNLCTEIFLPLIRRDGVREEVMSQLCVLGNEDVSRSQSLLRSERREVRQVLVNMVNGVWDTLERSQELTEMFAKLPPVDLKSRPCGVGVTGFYSAACDAGVPYTRGRVEEQLIEFLDDCRYFFNQLDKVPTVMFSIPPSSNSEFNMMCSPNVMHWDTMDVNIITRNGNWVLRNKRHRGECLSFNDKVLIASLLDQSLSLDEHIKGPHSLTEMIEYMLNGYAVVDGRRVMTKTISYYTKSNVQRSDKQCTETCDL